MDRIRWYQYQWARLVWNTMTDLVVKMHQRSFKAWVRLAEQQKLCDELKKIHEYNTGILLQRAVEQVTKDLGGSPAPALTRPKAKGRAKASARYV